MNETVRKMLRPVVAAVDQRIAALHASDFRIIFGQRPEMRVVPQEVRTFAEIVRDKASWVTRMLVADGGGEHRHIAGRLLLIRMSL
jgi:hypothetical protein